MNKCSNIWYSSPQFVNMTAKYTCKMCEKCSTWLKKGGGGGLTQYNSCMNDLILCYGLKPISLCLMKGTLQTEPMGELKMTNSHSTDYTTGTGAAQLVQWIHYGMEDQGIKIWFLTVVWDFSFRYNVQIGSGSECVSYSLCCGVHLPQSYSSWGIC